MLPHFAVRGQQFQRIRQRKDPGDRGRHIVTHPLPAQLIGHNPPRLPQSGQRIVEGKAIKQGAWCSGGGYRLGIRCSEECTQRLVKVWRGEGRTLIEGLAEGELRGV